MTRNSTIRSNIKPGLRVAIVLKKDQPTGRRTIGIVKDLLTSSPNHPRGIKVRLVDGQVGRVQEILSGPAAEEAAGYLLVQDEEGFFLSGSADGRISVCLLFACDLEEATEKACRRFGRGIGCDLAPALIFTCRDGRPVFHVFQKRAAMNRAGLPGGATFGWISDAEAAAAAASGRMLEKSREIYERLKREFDIQAE